MAADIGSCSCDAGTTHAPVGTHGPVPSARPTARALQPYRAAAAHTIAPSRTRTGTVGWRAGRSGFLEERVGIGTPPEARAPLSGKSSAGASHCGPAAQNYGYSCTIARTW